MHHAKMLAFLVVAGLLLGACHDQRSVASSQITPDTVDGVVTAPWGALVSGARVYLVPVSQVPTTAITSADVLSGAAEAYDEPLEDLIGSPAAASFPQGLTGTDGRFAIRNVDVNRSYFPFVATAGATPADLYPGGTLSRVARAGFALQGMAIEVTGHPSTSATYVGSSTCLTCHADYFTQRTHAHRLGFREPGRDGALQSLARKPGFDAGVTFFRDATVANFKTNGTSLWFHSYDASRGFDKFLVATADPGGASIRVFLWRNLSTGKYQVTMQNLATPSDPDRTFVVDLTYGGALHKQRYMLQIPDPGYKGRYPFLQYQHAGDNATYERTRRVWRDYHMDFFWDAGTSKFKFPSKSKAIESNCMACHATGYRYFTDTTTTERLADAVDDISGVFDLDGDNTPDELNTGCEVCHGPGSEHVAAASARAIVKPQALSPGRESQICGRCHDRVAGNDDLKNDQPLNAAGEMAPPGIRRAEFLANYTSRKGPKLSSFWVDQLHSKSHHQQYPDFIKSAHYRNGRRLVTCADCHDLHGKGAFDGNFRADPADGSLCATCHALDIAAHLVKYTGTDRHAETTSCTKCHYYKTAKTGAGRTGKLLGFPSGGPSDADITYWENDISSHLTRVATKENPGVRGSVPGKAMPVPFTNRCGACHDVRDLKNPK